MATTLTQPKVGIVSLGCPKALVDSERILTQLRAEGYVTAPAYADADLFVLPTYSENFGMAVAEALAAGTPAVVTKGAPWASLEQQQAGWWVDISIEALTAGLEAAMSRNRGELSRMGCNGKAWMAAEFSWLEIGRRMLRTYEWVLNGGSAPKWVLVD